jgi:hypothetical protein
LTCAPALTAGPAEERAAAEWTLLQGGRVRVEGVAETIRDLDRLPPGHFRLDLESIWSVATFFPEDLTRLAPLAALRELRLPGPIWNRNADGGKNLSAEIGSLAAVSTLERLSFSDHFLDQIRFDDSGLEAIASLTGLRELGLRQSIVKGNRPSSLRQLETLDLTLTRVDDARPTADRRHDEFAKAAVGRHPGHQRRSGASARVDRA